MGTQHDGLHAEHIQSALTGDAAAQSALVASWGRSMRLYGLNPEEKAPPNVLTDRELREARDRLGSLVATAQSSLDRLYSAVGGAGCCVLLADKDGVPVDRRGYEGDNTIFYKIGSLDGCRVERRERRHQWHRYSACRATGFDNSSRSALPQQEHCAFMHCRSDLRSSRSSHGSNRRVVRSFGSYRGFRQTDRCRSRGRSAAGGGGEFSAGFSQGQDRCCARP